MKQLTIIGGGSAGFGAAYQALIHGECEVILVEKNPGLGGTSTYGGVNCWEPGIGGNGVNRILAKRLEESGMGFVGECTQACSFEKPWGYSAKSADGYESTLIRGHLGYFEQRRFHFEPAAMNENMQRLLQEADKNNCLELLVNSELTEIRTENGHIQELCLRTPTGLRVLRPDIVIDATGDIVVARGCGCTATWGEEAQTTYGEPAAPEESTRVLNGISQVFRVTPAEPGYIQPIPEEYADVDLADWKEFMNRVNGPVSCFNEYGNGDINVNMLPTIEGEALMKMPYGKLKHLCEARVYAYWNWIGSIKNFTGWKIREIFPMLGIRESYRLVGKYVLTEADVRAGYAKSQGKEQSIAYADHPLDDHRLKGGKLEQISKYGIPYACLLPKEVDNLLVACRGASFSHIAASSARLSRTMMALGEAAGLAAAQCLANGSIPAEVNVEKIREIMGLE